MIGFVNIWGIFTVIFLVLSIWHWKRRNKRIAHFKVKERPLSQFASLKTLGSDLDQPLKDFADDFNKYINEYNKTYSQQQIGQAIGYGVASGTAIFSMLVIAL